MDPIKKALWCIESRFASELSLDEIAEVSGVSAWEDCRGRGLARALIGHVMREMVARGETPFLHSYADNAGAIGLYESLGFHIRRQVHVLVIAA